MELLMVFRFEISPEIHLESDIKSYATKRLFTMSLVRKQDTLLTPYISLNPLVPRIFHRINISSLPMCKA